MNKYKIDERGLGGEIVRTWIQWAPTRADVVKQYVAECTNDGLEELSLSITWLSGDTAFATEHSEAPVTVNPGVVQVVLTRASNGTDTVYYSPIEDAEAVAANFTGRMLAGDKLTITRLRSRPIYQDAAALADNHSKGEGI